MTKLVKGLILVISALAVVITVAGCSPRFVPQREETASLASPSSDFSISPTNGLVQSNTVGQVTIDAEWIKAEDDALIFNVSLNTHSVDLDRYDLGKLAVLRDDTNNEYAPLSWDSAPGGHHREGTLTFPLPDSVSQGEAKYLEIMIQNVAGIEVRILKWEL